MKRYLLLGCLIFVPLASASNISQRDTAVTALKATTLSYPAWVKNVNNNVYKNPDTTNWGKAFLALGQITDVVPPPSNGLYFDAPLLYTVSGGNLMLTNNILPLFNLKTDETWATFSFSIDGVPIGTFKSTGTNVPIQTTVPLSEGRHVITGVEVAPNVGYATVPVTFEIDVTPPSPPGKFALASFSDSGVQGDNQTTFTNPGLVGTGIPGTQVLVYSGTRVIGGSVVQPDGTWFARVSLGYGSYSITATQVDLATNSSAHTDPPLPLTISTTAP